MTTALLIVLEKPATDLPTSVAALAGTDMLVEPAQRLATMLGFELEK